MSSSDYFISRQNIKNASRIGIAGFVLAMLELPIVCLMLLEPIPPLGVLILFALLNAVIGSFAGAIIDNAIHGLPMPSHVVRWVITMTSMGTLMLLLVFVVTAGNRSLHPKYAVMVVIGLQLGLLIGRYLLSSILKSGIDKLAARFNNSESFEPPVYHPEHSEHPDNHRP